MSEAAAEPAGPPRENELEILAGLARGRALFNRGDFWGSHEALEAAWQVAADDRRALLRGLIQAGAAFHKLVVQDNPRGARELLRRALEGIDAARGLPEPPLGLDLGPFEAQLRRWAGQIETAEEPRSGIILGLPHLDWAAGAAAPIALDAVHLQRLQLGERRALLVAVEADGLRGWGECRLPWGVQGSWQTLAETLIPALLAEPVAFPSELPVLWQGLTTHAWAAAGLEAAVWDLWARRLGLPLHTVLGLSARDVPVAGRLRGTGPDALRRSLDDRLAAGYRRLVVPARPNADRRLLPDLLRGLDRPFVIELGAAYRRADIASLQVLDALGAEALARPTPVWDLHGAAALSRWLDTPLVLGDWTCEAQARGALALAACDGLTLDPGLAGLGESLRIAALAEEQGRPLLILGSAATAVGAAADLALACHPAVAPGVDLGNAGSGEAGAAGPLPALDDLGCLRPGGQAGLGFEPAPDWLEARTERYAVFRA